MEFKIMGGIRRTGSNGSYSYTVKPGRDDYPVVYVSYFDAMLFVNWLENGQPKGAQGIGTTEDGSACSLRSPSARALPGRAWPRNWRRR